MAIRMKVNGPAIINVAAQGTTSFAKLGLSERGVNIRIRHITQQVVTDASGEGPADIQSFGHSAYISFRLVTWEEVVLNQLFQLPIANLGTYEPGEFPPPGILLGASGAMRAIRIDSPYGYLPYIFPNCSLVDEKQVNLGTQRSGWDITLLAIAGVGSSLDPAGVESDANLCKLYYRPTN